MNNNKRYNLIKIISSDLLYHYKLPLLILIAIILSAVLVINTTYQTRYLINKYEQIILENKLLDIKWHNLVLEKNILSDHTYINYIATKKFKMQHVTSSQENIIVCSN